MRKAAILLRHVPTLNTVVTAEANDEAASAPAAMRHKPSTWMNTFAEARTDLAQRHELSHL